VKRDKSEPPSSIPEVDEKAAKEESSFPPEKREKEKEKTDASQTSPKKKVGVSATGCDVLADVTAYTMLPPGQGIRTALLQDLLKLICTQAGCSASQTSPKKKVGVSATGCDVLADVTAYTMLPPGQGVERIE
ncbi:hypothetical protein OSTOST_09425, partial [Ostertagia ostertagi]